MTGGGLMSMQCKVINGRRALIVPDAIGLMDNYAWSVCLN